MHLFDQFDSIVIINAAHRSDRLRQMRGMLSRLGLDTHGSKIVWFPAIDPKTPVGFSNPGSRGCFLSHIAVLNIARNACHQRVLILEDDCNFSADFQHLQSEVAGWLQTTPWSIAYLGHIESISGPPRLIPWVPDVPVRLTHCYAVAGDAILRLPGYLEAITLRSSGSPLGGPMSIDAGISWFRRDNPDVQTVLVAPSLGYQCTSRSDLSPRWFDRVPMFRDAADKARALRYRYIIGTQNRGKR